MGNSPIIPAPGQELEVGSFAYLKGVVKADPLFGVLLGMLALQVALAFLSGKFLSIIVSFAIFWGVFTLRYWGYLLALILSGLSLVGSSIILAVLLLMGGSDRLPARDYMLLLPIFFIIAINLCTIIILLLRQKYFA